MIPYGVSNLNLFNKTIPASCNIQLSDSTDQGVLFIKSISNYITLRESCGDCTTLQIASLGGLIDSPDKKGVHNLINTLKRYMYFSGKNIAYFTVHKHDPVKARKILPDLGFTIVKETTSPRHTVTPYTKFIGYLEIMDYISGYQPDGYTSNKNDPFYKEYIL